jgi:hypothetical protein
MCYLIDLVFDRPVAAMVSSVQMLVEDAPMATKLDAVISRITHTLSRAVARRHSSAGFTLALRAGTEETKGRII